MTASVENVTWNSIDAERSALTRCRPGYHTFPAGHASWCVQMPANLKHFGGKANPKLTTLGNGALQSGGDTRIAVIAIALRRFN